MHEMSICESLLQLIEDQSRSASFSKVSRVRLEIGPLAGVEVNALQFCYDVVCRGSLAENSQLEIIDMPITGWCMPCAEPVTLSERYDPCPQCGSNQVEITGGQELRIKDMEVT